MQPQVVVRIYLEDFVLLLALVFVLGMAISAVSRWWTGD